MTTFGWDASNYDDPPSMRDGIDFYTHKAAEGHHTYYDREYGVSLNNARNLGIPVLGAYYVNHPGSVNDQVDWFVQILDQDTPWWRMHPCFILQIDAEKFSYMPSAPTKAEIQAFGDRLVNVHGVLHNRILAYAPQWLYGNTLTGLSYRLWASAYGGNPVGHYRAVYPGDADGKRWQAYSGQVPMILQYGSNTTIGNQTTCDANAYRGTLQQLMTDLSGGSAPSGDDDMPKLFRVNETGMILITSGTTWYHLGTNELVEAAKRIWGFGDPGPLNLEDLPACGVQVPFPVTSDGGVDITPAQLEEIKGAAHAGAADGIDGAVMHKPA